MVKGRDVARLFHVRQNKLSCQDWSPLNLIHDPGQGTDWRGGGTVLAPSQSEGRRSSPDSSRRKNGLRYYSRDQGSHALILSVRIAGSVKVGVFVGPRRYAFERACWTTATYFLAFSVMISMLPFANAELSTRSLPTPKAHAPAER